MGQPSQPSNQQQQQQQQEEQSGISPVLDKILERLEIIQATKCNKTADEEEEKNLPCCFAHSLLRWTSPQVIKESYKPHMNIYYPYMKMNEMEQGAIHMESGQSEVVCEDKNTFEDSNKEDNRLI